LHCRKKGKKAHDLRDEHFFGNTYDLGGLGRRDFLARMLRGLPDILGTHAASGVIVTSSNG
jgi:hypothetical protein